MAAPRSKLTPLSQEAICTAIRETGCSDTAAVAACGIHPSTLTLWKEQAHAGSERHVTLINAMTHARAEAEVNLLKKMQERGEAQQDWREIAWRLERGWKEHWGKTERHEISGPDGEALKVYMQCDLTEEV